MVAKHEYYKTRGEAEKARKKFGHIYYEPGEGWYIVYRYRVLEGIFGFERRVSRW
jgi:hypothetical protein